MKTYKVTLIENGEKENSDIERYATIKEISVVRAYSKIAHLSTFSNYRVTGVEEV